MQETIAAVWLFAVTLGFCYSAMNPDYLIRITAWSNRLVGWDWPTKKDSTFIRILAATAAVACAVGGLLLLRGY